jgi:hypothetical protein
MEKAKEGNNRAGGPTLQAKRAATPLALAKGVAVIARGTPDEVRL